MINSHKEVKYKMFDRVMQFCHIHLGRTFSVTIYLTCTRMQPIWLIAKDVAIVSLIANELKNRRLKYVIQMHDPGI